MSGAGVGLRSSLYPQAILGYRAFVVREGKLCSLVQETFWQSGVNKAVCLAFEHHRPPVKDCDCGFYAYHTVDDTIKTIEALAEMKGMYPEPLLIAAIAGRGAVRIHAQGWRSQEAQIIVLGDLFEVVSEDFLQDLGVLYQVPISRSLNRLKMIAGAYARSVDKETLPPGRQLNFPDFT